MKIFQFLRSQIKNPVFIGFICSSIVHLGILASIFGIFTSEDKIAQVGANTITMSLASFNTNSNQKNYSTPTKSKPPKPKHKHKKEKIPKKHKPKNPIPIQEEQEETKQDTTPQEEVVTQKDTLPSPIEQDTQSAPSSQTSEGSTQESLAYNEGVSDEFLGKIQEAIKKKHHYPRLARIREIQGIVTVEFILNTDGSIHALKVFHSNTGDILNQQALKTIQEAYKNFPLPPKQVRLKIPIEYTLTL